MQGCYRTKARPMAMQADCLHCAKALMRSQPEVSRAPPCHAFNGQHQIDGDIPAETQAQMLARYVQDL